AKGQLTKSTRYVGTDAYVKENLGFTADYQPTSVRHTIPEAGVAGVYTYVNTYNQDGSPYTNQLPAAGELKKETLRLGYDALGQPTTVRTGYGTNAETDLVAATDYTALGELGHYTLRNNNGGVVESTRTYDSVTRRLSRIWSSKQTAPTTLSDVGYSYDDFGGVTRVADQTSGDTQCFRADHLRRLTEAWTPGDGDCAPNPATPALGGPAKYWQSFFYDVAGNRTTSVEHATAGDQTTTYTQVAGRHALAGTSVTAAAGTKTGSYTYDAAGNQLTRPTPANGTQTMTWDAEGHLDSSVDSSGTTTYVYDADGNRLIRRDPVGKTLYLPGQEVRSVNGVTTCVRYYSHAGQSVAFRAATGLTWLVGDQHGTAETTVTAVGQAVATRRTTPFGGVRAAVGAWSTAMDKGFVGGTDDNTGLTHLGAREYDPATGRFTSVDPVIDNTDPQQMHGYTYGNNNPLSYVDADGRWSIGGALKKAGGAIASATVTVGKAVGNAAVSTVKEIRKDPLKFATGLVVGAAVALAVGAVCATGVGCVILAAAAAGAAAAGSEYGVDVAQGEKEFSVGELGKEMAIGGAIGGLTAGAGVVGGKILSKVKGALGRTDNLAEEAVEDSAAATRRTPASCHSFAPTTLVLMADGTTKPIGEIALGDTVLATDPETGEVRAEPVTTLHRNNDRDLTDLEVAAADGGVETLHTTWTHPFWDATDGRWVNAAELTPGHVLRSVDAEDVEVTAVRNHIGGRVMRDLTVADLHTYYVLAAGSPVLVHNNPDECPLAQAAEPAATPAQAVKLYEGVIYIGKDHMKWPKPGSGGIARDGEHELAVARTADNGKTFGSAVGAVGNLHPINQAVSAGDPVTQGVLAAVVLARAAALALASANRTLTNLSRMREDQR
ncbi:MAG: polymorphic toxin-type HINT domain-containing protein, partial [Umezawaea sp.]